MKMNFLELGVGKGNQFWKYLLVIILAWTVGKFFGIIPYVIAVESRKRQVGDDSVYDFSNTFDFVAMGMSLNLGLLLLMFAFAFALFVFIGLVKVFHNGRTYKETINGTKKIRWNRVWVGVITWGALMTISTGIGLITNPENYVFQFDIAKFIPLVLISLIFIPLQTTFEELTFRGYFAQGLAGLTRSRWVVFLVPSISFGLLHMGNPEVIEHGFWIMMPGYILVGLVWGLISILDDGIELAIGAHAINNVFLSLFVTYSSAVFQTYAVFEIQEINPARSLIAISLYSIVFVYVLWRIYKWDFSILNKRVEKQEEEVIDATENEPNIGEAKYHAVNI